MRGDAQLKLTLANREELVRDVDAGADVGCSGHEIVKFSVLRAENRAKTRITALDF